MAKRELTAGERDFLANIATKMFIISRHPPETGAMPQLLMEIRANYPRLSRGEIATMIRMEADKLEVK